ncbi:MAG TPA: PEP-CTERM sorting domain-containing protein [Candidatus Sulfotelmatobacter sp.]|nr:PEP-CTERM sorting domain-containing protein [Candidatus Sulfotelmatobacter sp.]
MKSAALVVVLSCFALTNLANASSTIDFSNSGGTLSGTNAGLTLSGSTLIAVIGFNGGGTITGNLGTVSFTTGALASGSLAMGGTLNGGGTFTINGNGTNGIPNGVLFSGAFSGPISWTLTTLAGGTHSYTLTGVLTGMLGGASVNAVTVQLTVNTGVGFFTGSALISGGDTTVASVPEPSTLAFFATGAMGMMGMMRRKLFAR